MTLAHYHYIRRKPGPHSSIFAVKPKPQFKQTHPETLAIILYCYPITMLKSRNIATHNYFMSPPTRRAMVKLTNQHVRYVSRVITDPRYRHLGLASWLLTESIKFQSVPILETLTPIDFTNHMFQKAGFQLYYNPAPPRYQEFIDRLSEFGITGVMLRHPKIIRKRLDCLSDDQQEWFWFRLKTFLKPFHHIVKHFWQPEAITFALNQLSYPNAYLIRFNNNHPKTPEIRGDPPHQKSP